MFFKIVNSYFSLTPMLYLLYFYPASHNKFEISVPTSESNDQNFSVWLPGCARQCHTSWRLYASCLRFWLWIFAQYW